MQSAPKQGCSRTEATAPSPNALGYARIPALFDGAHVRAWREVTHAVHREQGTIFVQLMHVGRVAHPHNMPRGARVLAPSALAAPGALHTDAAGEQPFPVPTPMTEVDIETAIEEHARASELTLEAGFDGVEIHAANGFLVDQFLNCASNRRSDRWGGTIENRIRFLRRSSRAYRVELAPIVWAFGSRRSTPTTGWRRMLRSRSYTKPWRRPCEHRNRLPASRRLLVARATGADPLREEEDPGGVRGDADPFGWLRSRAR